MTLAQIIASQNLTENQGYDLGFDLIQQARNAWRTAKTETSKKFWWEIYQTRCQEWQDLFLVKKETPLVKLG